MSAVLHTWRQTFHVDLSKGWNFQAIVGEGDAFVVAERDMWGVDWVPVDVGSVVVAHPSFPKQRHHVHVYQVGGAEPPEFFAAGEFSNGAWGFYLPTESMTTFLTSRAGRSR